MRSLALMLVCAAVPALAGDDDVSQYDGEYKYVSATGGYSQLCPDVVSVKGGKVHAGWLASYPNDGSYATEAKGKIKADGALHAKAEYLKLKGKVSCGDGECT